MIGEAFDDGRYRQVTFKATTPDCREPITRTSSLVATETHTFTFTVWPNVDLPVDGTLIELVVDANGALPSIEINAGAFFTTRTSEKDYFPNGFPWVEPTAD